MKILIRSPFDTTSGYGNDGIGIARALLDNGHDVRISPTSIGVPIPADIAGLLTYDLDPPFDLAIHHLEPHLVSLTQAEKNMARTNIFWSMWEWKSVNNLNASDWYETFTERTQHFDYIVGYDPNSSSAFEPYVGTERLRTVQGGFWAADWQLGNRVGEHKFSFGMNGKLTVRKGVYIAYAAFLLLKEKHPEVDAQLVLKSTAPVFPPEMKLPDGVVEVLGRWKNNQIREFYLSMDCLLAPSWGEGKNLGPMEALSCGVPIILSDIPAHRQWATSDIATFVPTEEKECIPGCLGWHVNPSILAEAMYDHYVDSFKYRAKALTGSNVIKASADWSKCVERLGLAINVRL